VFPKMADSGINIMIVAMRSVKDAPTKKIILYPY
jgi:hypothetical protein